jgi:MoaA/NifB/PqqE/SkfB family radical SAM enzyme
MFRVLETDAVFRHHFRNLHQVFLYVTDRCNLGCAQCIYKPSTSHFITEEIELSTVLNLLCTFRELGARKVTFLGGEPTLYGHKQGGRPLLELIEGAKSVGYEYVRLDTNGQHITRFLDNDEFRNLTELAFSLDGYSSSTNDPLRGEGTFLRAVDAIRRAIRNGYRVTVTCCVHRTLLDRESDGATKLEAMIRFAESLGAEQINFHDLFKVGVPMDTWTGAFAPDPADWCPVYEELAQKVHDRCFRISVRLPQCFVRKSAFDRNPSFYGYCPVKLGERVMVHPNGTIRVCSNLICTGFGIARYTDGRIEWDSSRGNEMAGHALSVSTPCTNRSRHRSYGDLVPLCFSFKPGQDEYVWRHRLNWDGRAQSCGESERETG